MQGSICTQSIYPFAKGLQNAVNECKDVSLLGKFAYLCCCIWQSCRAYSSMLCSVNCGTEHQTLERNPEVLLRWEIRNFLSMGGIVPPFGLGLLPAIALGRVRSCSLPCPQDSREISPGSTEQAPRPLQQKLLASCSKTPSPQKVSAVKRLGLL